MSKHVIRCSCTINPSDGGRRRHRGCPVHGDNVVRPRDEHDQPMPTPNDSTDIQSLVIADIAARREVGIQRYGTPLQAGNGRDALQDAYEEALDLAMYLRQAIEERDG